MTPQFLRHEAARFRGMAEDADREAAKVRLLAMAVEDEARAAVYDEVIEPNSGDAVGEMIERQAHMAISELDEPSLREFPKTNTGRRIVTRAKETVLVRRRPVGRHRGE